MDTFSVTETRGGTILCDYGLWTKKYVKTATFCCVQGLKKTAKCPASLPLRCICTQINFFLWILDSCTTSSWILNIHATWKSYHGTKIVISEALLLNSHNISIVILLEKVYNKIKNDWWIHSLFYLERKVIF